MNDADSPNIIFVAFGTMFGVLFIARILYYAWEKYAAVVKAKRLLAKRDEQNFIIYQWAGALGLDFRPQDNQLRVTERMEASPEKAFFRADIALDVEDDTCFVSGNVANRTVWVYALKAISKSNADALRTEMGMQTGFTLGLFDSRGPHYAETVIPEMHMWCMEVQTVSIQHQVIVTRKKVQEGDVLTTESRDFEKTFDISGTQESDVLQLLDPAMMDLIMQCPADALEFSDQSVVLYRFHPDISAELLDRTLQSGLAIAQQVERNYPKAK